MLTQLQVRHERHVITRFSFFKWSTYLAELPLKQGLVVDCKTLKKNLIAKSGKKYIYESFHKLN